MELNHLEKSIDSIISISKSEKNGNKSIKELKRIIGEIKEIYLKKDNPLKEKINLIKKTYIKNWEEENMDFVKKIVEEIDINKGIPLPILSICGKGTREIRFTEYLSYFLNPNKNHGLGDKFLRVIFKNECKENNLSSCWFENCEVISEYKIGQFLENENKIHCYADIVINHEDFIIVVEHKILSSESSNQNSALKQLERYDRSLNNNTKLKNKKHIKMFLTPEKISNISSNEWEILSHKEIIYRGIKLLSDDSISKIAKNNLLRLLIDLAIGPYEKFEKSIFEIYSISNQLIDDGFSLDRALKFEKMIDNNNQVIELLMEVD